MTQSIDAAHIDNQREFSLRTFGPVERTAGILAHITKEVEEVRAKPYDLEEWIDIIILAIDGAHRTGAGSQTIIDGIKAKQVKNETRKWPDWRTVEPDAPFEHDRTGEILEHITWIDLMHIARSIPRIDGVPNYREIMRVVSEKLKHPPKFIQGGVLCDRCQQPPATKALCLIEGYEHVCDGCLTPSESQSFETGDAA